MTAIAGGSHPHDMTNVGAGTTEGLNLIVEDTYWTADLQDKAAGLDNPQQFLLTFPDGSRLTRAMPIGWCEGCERSGRPTDGLLHIA